MLWSVKRLLLEHNSLFSFLQRPAFSPLLLAQNDLSNKVIGACKKAAEKTELNLQPNLSSILCWGWVKIDPVKICWVNIGTSQQPVQYGRISPVAGGFFFCNIWLSENRLSENRLSEYWKLVQYRQACSSQIQYLSNSTKITTNTETAMLSI